MRILLTISLSSAILAVLALPAVAAFALPDAAQQVFPENPESARAIARAIAFAAAVIGSGYAIGRAGAAGLAGTAERPEIRTTAIIITALGEAVAIYGLVVVLLLT